MNANNRRRIYDAVISGLEGGSYSSFQVEGDWEKAWRAASAVMPNAFRHIVITDRMCDLPEERAGIPLALSDVALDRGVRILQERYPHHWADILEENSDAITGDVLLQCAAFGDIVYG